MEDLAMNDSRRVIIEQICSDLCEIKGAKISDVQIYAQAAVLRRSGFEICFHRKTNNGRYFPAWVRQWLSSDCTLQITCYADGNEEDLANNSQHYFEQLGIGIVLAHFPKFVADCLTPSVTLQNFRKNYPQYAFLGDKVGDILKGMLNDR